MRLPLQCIPLATLPHLDNPAQPLWQEAETVRQHQKRLFGLSGLSGYLAERN
jgi:hypothetical protein